MLCILSARRLTSLSTNVSRFCLSTSASSGSESSSSAPTITKKKNVPSAPRKIVEARKLNIHFSPLKMGFLAELIRGAWVPDALAQLKFSPKHKCEDVEKILRRAVSLARLQWSAIPEELVVREVVVGKGATVKRHRIMGKGRTGVSRQRQSHVTIRIEQVHFGRELSRVGLTGRGAQARKWSHWQKRAEEARSAPKTDYPTRARALRSK